LNSVEAIRFANSLQHQAQLALNLNMPINLLDDITSINPHYYYVSTHQIAITPDILYNSILSIAYHNQFSFYKFNQNQLAFLNFQLANTINHTTMIHKPSLYHALKFLFPILETSFRHFTVKANHPISSSERSYLFGRYIFPEVLAHVKNFDYQIETDNQDLFVSELINTFLNTTHRSMPIIDCVNQITHDSPIELYDPLEQLDSSNSYIYSLIKFIQNSMNLRFINFYHKCHFTVSVVGLDAISVSLLH